MKNSTAFVGKILEITFLSALFTVLTSAIVIAIRPEILAMAWLYFQL